MNWRRAARRRSPRRLRFSTHGARAALKWRWLSSRLFRQSLSSAAILLVVILLASLPFKPSQDFRTVVQDVLVSDFDFSRLAGQIGFRWNLADYYPEFIRARLAGDDDEPEEAVPVLGEDDLASLHLPVEGQVVSWFGWRDLPGGGEEFHPGLDFIAEEGSPVRAAAEGVVVSIYEGTHTRGYAVEIRHGERWSTLYAGLLELQVIEGDQVEKGQEIGGLGSEDDPHLHFELHAAGNAVDPAPRLGLKGN